MEGFFDPNDLYIDTPDLLCHKCGLDKKCLSPRMPYTGEGRLKILIIAEAPGEEEDKQNKQLVGDVGIFFRKLLAERNLDLDADFWKMNAVSCRPPNNREPAKNELACCFPNVQKAIHDLKPKLVWLMGKSAIESYFMSRFSTLTPSRWRGLLIPDFERNVWVVSTYHPSYALRNQDNSLIMSQYIRDLDFALDCMRVRHLDKLERPNEDAVRISTDFDEVCDVLDSVAKNPPKYLYFDYETTGLKPYREGHKIHSVSFCGDDNKSFSFPLQRHWTASQQKSVEEKWKKVLLNKSKKIAHNISFEDVWSRIILDTTPNSWYWDTMLVAHILDNRPKYSGLKFQAFLHWGIGDYGKDIRSYLESFDDSGFNRIHKAPIGKLLLYGGLDSLYGKHLFLKQTKLVDPLLEKGIDLFIEGTLAFADMQINGITVNKKYYKNAHKELEQRIEERKKELQEFPECKKFFEVTGRLPNLGSTDDLRQMFFDIGKLKPPKVTEKGNISVDADAMARIKSPLATEISNLNKIKKIDNTYISQFIREIDTDGKVHPFFNLGTVRTYRSSSDKPNMQNTPVRNKEAKRLSRSGIMPSKGFKIIDWDYAAIEVRAGACYTKDPALIAYINDPTTDMHKDTASDIFMLDTDKVTKELRFYVKNGFVFPEWYGSYYKNCAINIWRECKELPTKDGIPLIEHLESVGLIRSRREAEDSFIGHVKRVERNYWKKFHVFKEWQEEWYKSYEKTGLVEFLTGFRCKGYMGRNELVNYPFQGTAFHCLLWSVIQINAELRYRKMRSKVIAQIHDCAVIDCDPDELKEVKELCTEISTLRIREEYPWIIVPLEIEWEETEIDQSWYSKTLMKED